MRFTARFSLIDNDLLLWHSVIKRNVNSQKVLIFRVTFVNGTSIAVTMRRFHLKKLSYFYEIDFAFDYRNVGSFYRVEILEQVPLLESISENCKFLTQLLTSANV